MLSLSFFLSLSLSLSLFSHASWNLRETSAVAPVRSLRSSPPDSLWGLETREISRYTIRRRSVTNKLQPALGPSLTRSHFHLFPVSPAVQELEELRDAMVFERSSSKWGTKREVAVSERPLTRSDFIQRSPACCLASPMEQETGTRESAALSASRERDRQEVKRKASSRHRIDRPGRSLAHRASEGRREKHVFVSLFSTKITSREQHSSCK